MTNDKKINLKKYKLIIFDFDGVIADSLGAYRKLDCLLIKKLYGVDEKIKNLESLSQTIKTGTTNNTENDYYRTIDKTYGNGNTRLDKIWEEIFLLAPIVQKNIKLKVGVYDALKRIREKTRVPIALVTSSNRRDIDFFSKPTSAIGKKIDLNNFFDMIVTADDVTEPKPAPESFQKTIDFFGANAEDVLIFEDSLSGVKAGKTINATVIAIEDIHNKKDKEKIEKMADDYLKSWLDFII